MRRITEEEFINLKINKPRTRFSGVVTSPMGWKRYYLKGKMHRTDGPALEMNDGHREWWWHGNLIAMSDFVHSAPDIHSPISKSMRLKDQQFVEVEIVKGTMYQDIDQIYFRKILCADGVFYIPILPGM